MCKLYSFKNTLVKNVMHEKAIETTNTDYFYIYILFIHKFINADLRKARKWDIVRQVNASWMFSKISNLKNIKFSAHSLRQEPK